jgi:hypothetical protein
VQFDVVAHATAECAGRILDDVEFHGVRVPLYRASVELQ